MLLCHSLVVTIAMIKLLVYHVSGSESQQNANNTTMSSSISQQHALIAAFYCIENIKQFTAFSYGRPEWPVVISRFSTQCNIGYL